MQRASLIATLVSTGLCAAMNALTCDARAAAPAATARSDAATGAACSALLRETAPAAAATALIASYPSAPNGLLHDSAFVYDNAAAAIALVACDNAPRARHIADALLYAQDHDRFWHDGRLRNGYLPGTAFDGVMHHPGFWDATQKRWLEDSYQVGSDSGNLAWAMLALLRVYSVTHDARYLAGATRLGTWLEAQADTRGDGGYRGGFEGFEPQPAQVAWKSTEHNIDLYAAFAWLAQVSADPRWHADARRAQSFVTAAWQPDCGCFATGTDIDGVRYSRFLALDAQVWALLALPGMESKRAPVQALLEKRLRSGDGYTYSEAGHALWSEGTAQVELLWRVLGRGADAATLHAVVETQRAPDGGVYATDVESLDTGFGGRKYRHQSHLGASAWAALAEQGLNPFAPPPR